MMTRARREKEQRDKEAAAARSPRSEPRLFTSRPARARGAACSARSRSRTSPGRSRSSSARPRHAISSASNPIARWLTPDRIHLHEEVNALVTVEVIARERIASSLAPRPRPPRRFAPAPVLSLAARIAVRPAHGERQRSYGCVGSVLVMGFAAGFRAVRVFALHSCPSGFVSLATVGGTFHRFRCPLVVHTVGRLAFSLVVGHRGLPATSPQSRVLSHPRTNMCSSWVRDFYWRA